MNILIRRLREAVKIQLFSKKMSWIQNSIETQGLAMVSVKTMELKVEYMETEFLNIILKKFLDLKNFWFLRPILSQQLGKFSEYDKLELTGPKRDYG